MDDFLRRITYTADHFYKENDRPLVDMVSPSYESQELFLRSVMANVQGDEGLSLYSGHNDYLFDCCKAELASMHDMFIDRLRENENVTVEGNMIILKFDSPEDIDRFKIIDYIRAAVVQDLLENWEDMKQVVMN